MTNLLDSNALDSLKRVFKASNINNRMRTDMEVLRFFNQPKSSQAPLQSFDFEEIALMIEKRDKLLNFIKIQFLKNLGKDIDLPVPGLYPTPATSDAAKKQRIKRTERKEKIKKRALKKLSLTRISAKKKNSIIRRANQLLKKTKWFPKKASKGASINRSLQLDISTYLRDANFVTPVSHLKIPNQSENGESGRDSGRQPTNTASNNSDDKSIDPLTLKPFWKLQTESEQNALKSVPTTVKNGDPIRSGMPSAKSSSDFRRRL